MCVVITTDLSTYDCITIFVLNRRQRDRPDAWPSQPQHPGGGSAQARVRRQDTEHHRKRGEGGSARVPRQPPGEVQGEMLVFVNAIWQSSVCQLEVKQTEVIILRLVPQVGWLKAKDQTILALHKRVITHNQRIDVDHEAGQQKENTYVHTCIPLKD